MTVPPRHELHRQAVHAIALAGRRRAVVEDVAEMAAAAAAMDLGRGCIEQAAILAGCRTAFGSGRKKLGQPVPLSYLAREE